MNPLLLKVSEKFEQDRTTYVHTPWYSSFNSKCSQQDVDNFFAELGYAEAIPLPYEYKEDGLYVSFFRLLAVKVLFDKGSIYENAGFFEAIDLPYEVTSEGLFVSSKLTTSAKNAGYDFAEILQKENNLFDYYD